MNKFPRGAGRGGRPTVLIVDDEVSIRESLQRVLEVAGYRAVGVSDPDQAFIRLAQETFDAIILDICLEGGRSGLEVLRFVRSTEQLAQVPVIVLTGVLRLNTHDEKFVRRYSAHVFFKPQIPEVINQLDALMHRACQ